MKYKIYHLVYCTALLLLTAACKKDRLLTYSASNNVYFNYIAGADPSQNQLGLYEDSIAITFAFSPSAVRDTVLGIPIAVTGEAKNYDRVIKIVADPASTAQPSTHYEFPATFVMPAGKTSDSVHIRFKRSADLTTTDVLLHLRLQESDQFTTQLKFRSATPKMQNRPIPNTDTVWTTSFKIIINDKLSAGPYWDRDYSSYFGDFSEKKVRLLNQLVGMPLDTWSVPVTTSQQRSDLNYYGGFTARYLKDQAFAGNMIFEADGVTIMKMGYLFD